MTAKKAAAKKLKVTQVRSAIGCPADQRATVRALGLKRINDTVEQADTPAVRGMVVQGQAPREGGGALESERLSGPGAPSAAGTRQRCVRNESAGGERPARRGDPPGANEGAAHMQINDLFPAPGSRKDRKRVGRGNGQRPRQPSGRGDKGQNSRAGGGKGPGFEGGQNPLHMRLPKLPGFKNRFRTEYAVVNVVRLEEMFAGGRRRRRRRALVEKGVVKSTTAPVKVLGDGEITKTLTVKVDKVSGPAKAKIEAAGGTVETL